MKDITIKEKKKLIMNAINTERGRSLLAMSLHDRIRQMMVFSRLGIYIPIPLPQPLKTDYIS